MNEKKYSEENEKKYSEEVLEKARYRFYQLYWMILHGYTLQDLMTSMAGYAKEVLEIVQGDPDAEKEAMKTISDPQLLFQEWQEEYGFGCDIWSCFGEFLDMDDAELRESGVYEEHQMTLDLYAAEIQKEEAAEE